MFDARRLAASTCGLTVAAFMLFPSTQPLPTDEAATVEAASASIPESDLWLVPQSKPRGTSPLARAVAALAAGQATQALPLLREAGDDDPKLEGYAHLYEGRARLALSQPEPAAAAARRVLDKTPGGYLGEAALWLLADAAEMAGRWDEAYTTLSSIAEIGTSNPAEAWLRLGRAAEKVGEASAARQAFAKLHYEMPLTAQAREAGQALAKYPAPAGPERLKRELARAELLYAGRRYADARDAFEGVRSQTGGDERSLVDLRLAQCDTGLRRYPAAHRTLAALLDRTWARRAEVELAYLGTLRGLGREAEYVARVPSFVKAHPESPLAESALNDLGTHYILTDRDEAAAKVFTEMYARFPLGQFADRAAWKAGWWAYRTGNYREATRLFESAAIAMRRADYRPSWLYWSARAHLQLGEPEAALTWFRHTIASYRNSYYGREASRAIDAMKRGRHASIVTAAPAPEPVPLALVAGTRPPNTDLIQRLLDAGLYDDAVFEIRKVQTQAGSAPLLEATVAYALNRKGELRPAITAMRRAYPQFMAEGGEALPRSILAIIFPIAHWDLLRRYAEEHRLDRYLLAAQVAQESTFQADVRSVANAYGLMQILPSTGRRYAPKVGVRGFTTAKLTDPEINVRIGTQYFRDLVDMFDDVAPALAAYNAGENRVARWRADRPGIDRDEFVDDIPFPETQNYVKRILGTAEDYRILYGQEQTASR
jgi:soluble lytic murein transglycosylase